MRIVLQDKTTGLYFQDAGLWTAQSADAFEFVSSTEAMQFCFENKLKDVHIVLKFEQEKYDIVMQEAWKTMPRKFLARAGV